MQRVMVAVRCGDHERDLDLPAQIAIERLLVHILPESEPQSWVPVNEATGKQIGGDQTLFDAGIWNGSRLLVMPEAMVAELQQPMQPEAGGDKKIRQTVMQAQSHHQQGDLEQALKVLAKAYQLAPRIAVRAYVRELVAAATLATEQQDTNTARKRYQTALALVPPGDRYEPLRGMLINKVATLEASGRMEKAQNN